MNDCQSQTESAPEFDWYNNRTVRESLLLVRTEDEGWKVVTTWTPVPFTDPDAFLRTFTESESWNDETDNACVGVDFIRESAYDAWTPEVRDGFVLYFGSFGMIYRERTVYSGLYDNVERLREYVRTLPATDNPETENVLADISLALSMILVHDRGERDRMAPEGYCRHGVYVGGCGIDWTCGACEDGCE